MLELLNVTIGVLLLVTAAGVWLMVRTMREQAVVKLARKVEMLQVMVPGRHRGETAEHIEVARRLWEILAHLPGRPILVFEVVRARDGSVAFYLGAERRWIPEVAVHIKALYPRAKLKNVGRASVYRRGDAARVGRLILPRLSGSAQLDEATDPLGVLTRGLSAIRLGDAGVVQLVCRPTRDGRRFNTNTRLGVFAGGEEAAEQAFGAVAEMLSEQRIIKSVSFSARQATVPGRWRRDMVARVPREETAIQLTAGEIAGLFHFA